MKYNIKTEQGENGQIIKFYDADYAGKKGFDELGQFASSYYIITLMGDRKQLEETGLDLHGCVPKWKLTGKQMKAVFIALDEPQTAKKYAVTVQSIMTKHKKGTA